MTLGTRTRFQIDILIRSTLSTIHKFRENILESSRSVSDPPVSPDYGVPLLRNEDRNEEQQEDEDWKMMRTAIYRGPETLHPGYKGPTQEGDVYAFSMILIEVATRNDPQGVRTSVYNEVNLGIFPLTPTAQKTPQTNVSHTVARVWGHLLYRQIWNQ